MRHTNSWGKLLDWAHNCRQLCDWLKGLICMLLSSPTNSQEAPVDKVNSVSLPVCQPRRKTDQTAHSRLGECRRRPCSWSSGQWWPQIHVRGDRHPGSQMQGQKPKTTPRSLTCGRSRFFVFLDLQWVHQRLKHNLCVYLTCFNLEFYLLREKN